MNKLRTGLKFKALLHQNRCGLYIHEYQAYDLLKKYGLPLVPVTHPHKIELQGQQR